jgi:hypothetical protein
VIRLPSLFKPYDCYVPCDPALKQPPAVPEGATEEQLKEHDEAYREYLATVLACMDTGDWTPLLVPGQTPLKFVLAHVDRMALRALIDRMRLPAENPRHVGERLGQSLYVRLALVDIVGAEFKVQREPDPQWDGWVMARAEVIQSLDAADARIVAELALAIQRKTFLSPK